MADTTTETTAEVPFKDSWASVLLDLVRGVAAVLVLLSHWKVTFFVDYPLIGGRRWPFAIPYVLCDAGHQAVIIFFVLSGYLIGNSVLQWLRRGTWGWPRYFLHRLTRLWVVVVPGLALTFLLDWIGMHHTHWPSLYLGGSPKAHSWVVSSGTNWPTFWGNLLFLQTVRFPVFGSNASLWSLSNEFWYYILFPLGLLGLRPGTHWMKRAVYLALGVGVAWGVRDPLLALFPVWLAGVVLDFLPRPSVRPTLRWIGGLLYVPCVFLAAKLPVPDLEKDYGFCALTVIFLWLLLSARNLRATGALVQPIQTLARFSFSLYVIHMPLLLLSAALTVGERTGSPKDLRLDGLAVAVFVSVLGFAYGLGWLTEFRTADVRVWIGERTGIERRSRLGGRA